MATAGDVNGDGYSDVVVGAPQYANGTGRVFLYQGSASGLGTIPALTLDSSNGIAAGDTNGDGFSDLVVGSFYNSSLGLHYGNGHRGLPRIPRQAQPGFAAPLALLGKSSGEHEFGIRSLIRTAAGRGRYHLEVEVQPLGTPFDGTRHWPVIWARPEVSQTGSPTHCPGGGTCALVAGFRGAFYDSRT